jgi:hypothetical protein
MGVLSALPLVNVFNVCCCGWVICGGLVAAYVLQQNTAVMITPGDGALVGLLAGLMGAFIAVFVSIPIDILVGPMERRFAEQIVDMAGTMPPEMRDFLGRYSRGGAEGFGYFVIGKIVALMFWLVAGAIFSTIGGALGALLFKKPPPPAVVDVPPAS